MSTRLKILALLALSVIGFGIYAISDGSGNKNTDEKSTNALVKTDTLAALKPLASGKMGAMRILDAPINLSTIAFINDAGAPVTIADWKGKTVLLNLWATWCPPCRHEMPSLEDLQVQLGGDDFEVVTVSIDAGSTDKPKAFFQEINLKALNFYWDGTTKIFADLKKQGLAFGMPSTVLIDKNGNALGALNGPAEWNSPDAIALIKKAM